MALSNPLQNFGMRRESAGLVLAVDATTIGLDIENAASAGDQRCVEAKLFLDRGRQTGGLWLVVSLHAKRDADFHELLHQRLRRDYFVAIA